LLVLSLARALGRRILKAFLFFKMR